MSEKSEALKEIRARIGGCFGAADKIFAGHKFDEDHAKELRELAFRAGIPRSVILQLIRDHLEGCTVEHIKEQIIRAEKFFKKLS